MRGEHNWASQRRSPTYHLYCLFKENPWINKAVKHPIQDFPRLSYHWTLLPCRIPTINAKITSTVQDSRLKKQYVGPRGQHWLGGRLYFDMVLVYNS